MQRTVATMHLVGYRMKGSSIAMTLCVITGMKGTGTHFHLSVHVLVSRSLASFQSIRMYTTTFQVLQTLARS